MIRFSISDQGKQKDLKMITNNKYHTHILKPFFKETNNRTEPNKTYQINKDGPFLPYRELNHDCK